MNHKILKITLLLCLGASMAWAQNKTVQKVEKKKGMFSFGFNYSDYGFIKAVKDSSISAAFSRDGLFKSGSSSFGFDLSYWKGLGSHMDLSANLAGTLSNFPKLYVKDDSIGNAKFTPQLDATLNFRAFEDHRKINPFLTGGIGAGYFGKQLVVYAPVGVGLQFRFNRTFIFVKAQWRMALTDGIKDDYMFYSLSIGQQKKVKKDAKKPVKETEAIPVATVKQLEPTEPTEPKETDTDGDGVPDIRDNCPTEKGTVMGCPDSDGDGIADKDDHCRDEKGDARYKGCPVPDTDGDGINDDDDKCKTEAGTRANNGCPDEPEETDETRDTDGDGIMDKYDKCPESAGLIENNGCPMKPVEGAKLIRSSGDSMTYFIRFDFDKANITVEAFSILNQMVKVLKADKSLNLKVEGHADSFGSEIYNVQISSERANVAKDYFSSYGIARSRISTAWYGSTKPYDIHQDWLNRRVEITIYKKK